MFAHITKAVDWLVKHIPEHGDTYGAKSIKELGKRRVEYLALALVLMRSKYPHEEDYSKLVIDIDGDQGLTPGYMFQKDASRKRAEEYLEAITHFTAPLMKVDGQVKIRPEWQEAMKDWEMNAYKTEQKK